ncbi:MAG: ACT domain-containing protein [Acidobacteria bacterium]|nr:ACT domain-containing protein [Acidobacteriota bacterium]MBV9479031.1 ACT domain-containing protein [Acidobacteriota bacterium]
MRIAMLDVRLAVCRLASDAELPSWPRGAFTCVTRTRDELSIVCDEDAVPDDVQAERGWRAFQVEGPIPFEVTGVAAALVGPLANARISVFPIATYDTDYVLVKAESFENAAGVLRSAGHDVR